MTTRRRQDGEGRSLRWTGFSAQTPSLICDAIETLVKRQELGGTVEILMVIASTKDATHLLEDSLIFK